MPCYTRIQVALDTGRYDMDTLERALRAAGFHVERIGRTLFFDRDQDNDRALRGTYDVGKLEVLASSAERRGAFEAALRQGYAREAITASAKRHGIKVEQDAKDPMVLRLTTDGRTG